MAIRRDIKIVRLSITYQKAITRSTVTAYVPASDKVTRRCRVIVVFCTILYIRANTQHTQGSCLEIAAR